MELEFSQPEPSRRTVADLLKRYAEEITPKSDVRAPDIAAWRDVRAKKDKASSVQRDTNWLRNAFTIGRLEWHWIDHNPFDGVRGPGATFSRGRRIPPSEVKTLCRALHCRTGVPPETKGQEVALIFPIALRTARPAGEILSLGRDTLDMPRRIARVPHKMQYLTPKGLNTDTDDMTSFPAPSPQTKTASWHTVWRVNAFSSAP